MDPRPNHDARETPTSAPSARGGTDETAAPPVARLRPRLQLPRVSGCGSVLVLFCCFALTAVLVPVTLSLPTWVEAEFVLGGWWLIWAVTLSVCFYRHALIEHDYTGMRGPQGKDYLRGLVQGPGRHGLIPMAGDASPLGCLIGLAVTLLALLVAWLVGEFVLPFLALTIYFVVWNMLALAVNKRHRCRGRLLLAVGWGGFWATVYTAPLALIVWVVHQSAGR